MRSRRLLALPLALLAGALLSGCGDESADGSSDGSEETAVDARPTPRSGLLAGNPLDLAEVSSALLTASNLPGFADLGPSDPGEETEDDGKSGCESQTPFEDRFDRGRLAVTASDVGFLYADDARLLVVSEVVASFAQDDEAEFALSALGDDLDECTRIEDVGEAGETTTIDLEYDDDASAGADQQFNLLGTGVLSSPDYGDVDVSVGLSVARVDNSVTLTQLISLGSAADVDLHLPYADLAVSRLASVLAGEIPTEEPGPIPSPIPASRLPLPADAATLEQFLDVSPRFALPD